MAGRYTPTAPSVQAPAIEPARYTPTAPAAGRDPGRSVPVVIPTVGGWVVAGGGSPTTVLAGRDTLNKQTRITQQQLSICASDQPLRFGYGKCRVGAMWLKPIVSASGALILPFVIGRGPIDAVEAVEMGGAALPSGITATTHLGAPGQGVDATLEAAWAAAGYAYADTLPDIAWGFLTVSQAVQSFPADVTITARMRAVYDPRQDSTLGSALVAESGAAILVETGVDALLTESGSGSQRADNPATWAYSANPALALADFLASTAYGRGETLDWASVAQVADVCDEMVGGKPRRAFGLMLDSAQSVQAWEDVLRAYAGCWVVREGGITRLVGDAPAASVFTFDSANYLLDSIRISQRKRRDAPTLVSVAWTDTTVKPWAPRTHTEKAAGVDAGSLAWREESIQMPGIQDAGYAKREAVRRLNQYIVSDLTVTLTAFGEASVLRIGDVVAVTDAEGMTGKLFRLTEHSLKEPGIWQETLVEYDAAAYSDAIASGPAPVDPTLPTPLSPIPVTSLSVVEDLYMLANGTWASRVKASWTLPTYPFIGSVRVVITGGGATVADSPLSATANVFAAGPLQEGVAYTASVYVISTIGVQSSAASGSVTLIGKDAPPGNVTYLLAAQNGNKIVLSWNRADSTLNPGTPDLDVWKYELRYGATTGSWATATLIDKTDALNYTINTLPASGTYRYYVKAIDSVRQESATAATADLAVTADGENAIRIHQFPSMTPEHMNYSVVTTKDPQEWWQTGRNLVGNIWSYSSLNSPVWDVGTVVDGTWTAQYLAGLLSGTTPVTILFSFSEDGTNWWHVEESITRGRARYIKLSIRTSGKSEMYVQGYPRIILARNPITETVAEVTTSASSATLVQLTGQYLAARSIQLTPRMATATTCGFQRPLFSVVTGLQFDCTINGNGTQNAYVIYRISTAARVIAAGDFLEYDVWVNPSAPQFFEVGGFDILFTDTSRLNDNPPSDSYGTALRPIVIAGHWVSRKLSLAAFVGKTVAQWELACEADAPGHYSAVHRNIRVTDGAGTDRQVVWASGEPANAALHWSAYCADYACGPSNSFLAYAWNAAGTQIAAPLTAQFSGY